MRDICVVLNDIYNDLIRDAKSSKPNIIDGLTDNQRCVLYHLHAATSPMPLGELVVACNLALSDVEQALVFLTGELRRYPLVERVGDYCYQVTSIFYHLVDEFDPENPINNPILFSVPMVLFHGFYDRFQCFPSHCLSDFVSSPTKLETLSPDLVRGFVSSDGVWVNSIARWRFNEKSQDIVILDCPGVVESVEFLERLLNYKGVRGIQSIDKHWHIEFDKKIDFFNQCLIEENILTIKLLYGWDFCDKTETNHYFDSVSTANVWFDYARLRKGDLFDELFQKKMSELGGVLRAKYRDAHKSSIRFNSSVMDSDNRRLQRGRL